MRIDVVVGRDRVVLRFGPIGIQHSQSITTAWSRRHAWVKFWF